MKDVTEYIVKEGKKFYVDREDIDTGEIVTAPYNIVYFIHKGKKYKAVVTTETAGRDDDIYLLNIIDAIV